MLKNIELCGRNVEYDLQRKKVKNINLRIRSDGSISVSASDRVPLAVIEDFLLSHGEYIVKILDRYRDKYQEAPSSVEYNNGDLIYILGERYTIALNKGARNKAALEGGNLILTVTDTLSRELRKAAVEKLMHDVCRMIVTDICERVHPEFKEYVPEYPAVKFRKMRTKWGICRPTRKEVTFSYMLASVPIDCIEYVVYHEFCHFIHPDHSKSFYDCLSRFVPDWKNKKERLGEIGVIR
jgi:predicted metal-dependent hydrolase